jgi:hypothetical protein
LSNATLGGFHVAVQLGGKLSRFITLRRGYANCHSNVDHLMSDLKKLGVAERLEPKMGFSDLTQSNGAPMGLHSWIEVDGWAIDPPGGNMGKPILIRRIQPHREMMKATDVKPRNALPDDAGS